MAEPHSTTSTEDARRAGGAQGGAQAGAEPRSFDRSRSGEGGRGQQAGQAAQAAAQGGRQMVEQGRRVGRQMTDAWRQAFDPFLAMQYDMSQMFDDLVRQTFGFRTAPAAHPLRPLGHLSAVSLLGLPPADLKETENAHLLAIELPGLSKEDIDVSLSGETLVVCGHKAEENEDAAATYRVSERRYGRFERAFPLPLDVDRTRIEAQFKDGVLKITLPKTAEAAEARSRIEVKS